MRSFPIGPLWESREKSCSGQHRCAILLRQGRVCGGRHTNPSVYVWGLPPESAIGGKQLGVGFLTSLPCRAMTRTWKDDQWKGCRVHASCFQLGTRWVQGGVTYGHAAQPTTQETRSRTNELSSLLHERLVLQSQGLLGISTKKMAKSNAWGVQGQEVFSRIADADTYWYYWIPILASNEHLNTSPGEQWKINRPDTFHYHCWLFDRDRHFMVFEIIPTYLGSNYNPLYTLNNLSCFIAQHCNQIPASSWWFVRFELVDFMVLLCCLCQFTGNNL